MSQLRACTNTSGLYIHTYIAAITAAGGLGPELKAENKDCNNYSDAPLTVRCSPAQHATSKHETTRTNLADFLQLAPSAWPRAADPNQQKRTH